MQITIRPAVEKDCNRIMELVRELAAYEKAPDEVIISDEHFRESGFGPNPVWWAWVAEADGKVEGFALWYIRFSTWKGQRMYLEDIIVTEKLRGMGMGKLLFEKLLSECHERKLNGLVWQVLEWNEPAFNFYRKFPGVTFDYEWVNGSINLVDH